MIGLASNNRMLYVELVSMGSVNATTVESMNVFRVAVLKGAVLAIIAHNHPSGELKHSDNDMDTTDRLIQVGRILNIKVIDHMIITIKSYLSFKDIGLLEKLGQSTKWVPQFKLIKRIRKEEKIIRQQAIKDVREKTLKKRNVEISKVLKKKGVDINIIIEASGLTKEEIEKLR